MNLSLMETMPKFRGCTTICSMKDGRPVRLFFHKNQIMNGASLATMKLWGGYSNYKVGAI